MQCCANCFISPKLKEYIDDEGTVGDCVFCSNFAFISPPLGSNCMVFGNKNLNTIFNILHRVSYQIINIQSTHPDERRTRRD